jgi:hypothetical protein
MRRAVWLAAAALVLVSTAEPASARTITIDTGDTALIIDTSVVCSAETARGHARVSCFERAAGQPIPGTVGVSIADTGRVAVNVAKPGGGVSGLFQRSPQGAGGVFRIYLGDRVRVAGTPILCDVIRGLATSPRIFRGLKTRCYRTNRWGPVPQSLAVVVSERFAGVFAFNKFGAPGPDVYVQRQPSFSR